MNVSEREQNVKKNVRKTLRKTGLNTHLWLIIARTCGSKGIESGIFGWFL